MRTIKHALVIGASGAIGRAICRHLLNETSATVYGTARETDKIHETLRQSDRFKALKLDLLDEMSIQSASEMIEESLDLIVVATGILHSDGLKPEKSLREMSFANFERVFAINTFGPAMVAKYFAKKLSKETNSVMAILSARVGSISDNRLGGWYAYRASKAALNMLIKTLSIEIKRTHKVSAIIGLHPGTVDSNLSKPFQNNVPDGKLFTPEYSASELLKVVFDRTEIDTGKVFAFDGSEIEY